MVSNNLKDFSPSR